MMAVILSIVSRPVSSSCARDPIGDALAHAARESFMDGWEVMAFFTCGLSAIAVVLILRFMPPRHEPLPEIDAMAYEAVPLEG